MRPSIALKEKSEPTVTPDALSDELFGADNQEQVADELSQIEANMLAAGIFISNKMGGLAAAHELKLNDTGAVDTRTDKNGTVFVKTKFSWNAYNATDQDLRDRVVKKSQEVTRLKRTVAEVVAKKAAKEQAPAFATIDEIDSATHLEQMAVPTVATLHSARAAFESIGSTVDDDDRTVRVYNGVAQPVVLTKWNRLERNTQEATWTLSEEQREHYMFASEAETPEGLIEQDLRDYKNFCDIARSETPDAPEDELFEAFKTHRRRRVALSDALQGVVPASGEDANSSNPAVDKTLVMNPVEGGMPRANVVDPAEMQTEKKRWTPRALVAAGVVGALALGLSAFGVKAVQDTAQAASIEQLDRQPVEKSEPANDGLVDAQPIDELQKKAEAEASQAEAKTKQHTLQMQEARTVPLTGRGVWGAAEQFLAQHGLPTDDQYVNKLTMDSLNWSLAEARKQGYDVPATAEAFIASGADRIMPNMPVTFPLDSVKAIERMSGVKAN